MDTAVTVAALATFGAIVSATLVYLAARKANSVNEQANTIKWAEGLRADATEARQEAAEARKEATEAHRQMADVRREVQMMVDELRLIRRTAWREDMTMSAFREFLASRGTPGE